MKKSRAVALIDENRCIGCTLCIEACPVDAIVGATQQMHTVIAALCIGCKLCLPPCPMDCIDLLPVERHHDPAAVRAHYKLRQQRLQRERAALCGNSASEQEKKERIAAAIERARLTRPTQSIGVL